ncbi:MAG: efflux RND transporter permease subunit [Deltaproteobacteria bacterium]|nr:efflux RND transporter permease subunit [Deltaproteobacteria bacterium]
MKKVNHWVIAHPKTVLLMLLILTIFMASRLPGLRSETNLEAMFPDDHPTVTYNDQVEEWFEVKDSIVVGIFNKGKSGIYNGETLALIREITDGLRDMDGILNRKKSDVVSLASLDNVVGTDFGMDVTPFMKEVPGTAEEISALRAAVEDNEMVNGTIVSRDGTGAIIMAMIERDDKQVVMYRKVKELIGSLDKGETEVVLAGRPVIEGVFAATMQHDMPKMMRITILVILGVLLFTFHTLRGVFLPIILVIITLLWTFGTMAIFGVPIYTVMTMMPVILLAVGCADAIHILSKYYDEVIHHPHESKVTVVYNTMEELAPPVIMTSITTMAGFLSLLSSELMPMRFFGLFVATGIFYALILSITFLPATLSLLPLKVSTRKKRRFEEHGSFTHVDYAGKLLGLLARIINTRPGFMYVVTFIFIALGGYGLAQIKVSASLVKQFNEEHPVPRADEKLNSHFGGTNLLNIVVEGKEAEVIKNPAILKGMDSLQAFMLEDPDIGESISIAEYLKRMNRVLNENRKEMFKVPETRDLAAQYLFLYSMSGDPTDFDSVVDYNYQKANIRFQIKTDESSVIKSVLNRADEGIAKFFPGKDVTLKKAGTVAISDAFIDLIISGQIWSIFLSIILIFILTAIEFKSVVAGLCCIIPISVSAFFNFGFMGFIGIPLDVSTALTASMAIGIGVDYAIHMVNKYRLEARGGKSPHEVTRTTLLTAGRAIWYNALVVALGFLVLLSANLVPQQKLGMMISLTMMTCFGGAAMFLPVLLNRFKPAFVYGQKKEA